MLKIRAVEALASGAKFKEVPKHLVIKRNNILKIQNEGKIICHEQNVKILNKTVIVLCSCIAVQQEVISK